VEAKSGYRGQIGGETIVVRVRAVRYICMFVFVEHVDLSNMDTEQHILHTGIDQIKTLLPSHRVTLSERPDRVQYDAVVQLNRGGGCVNLSVEVKGSGKQVVWGKLLQQLSDAENPTLLTDYINPVLGEKLRAVRINYVDTIGNAYLNIDVNGLCLLVWIEGHKPRRYREEKADHAFTKTGLRVTYWLLLHPEQVNESMRTVAQATAVGLETVHRVRSSLHQRGFLVELRKNEWQLVNRKILLDKWIEGYATRLQPGLLLGRYRPLKNESVADWQQQALETPLTQWGGEPAADGLTDFLRPATWIIYTREPAQTVMKQLRLLPDPENGPVRIYEKFWPHDEPDPYVHPMLVYADLLISPDARNHEVAQRIYETHIQRLID